MGKGFYVDVMALHPEVTGSCNIVTIRFPNRKKVHFLVDCGLFQDEKYKSYNEELSFNPQNIDFCLVTHGHVDHIGRLPFISSKGYSAPIYTTEDTKKIMHMSLNDSARVLRESAKRKKVRPLYTESDVSDVMNMVYVCGFNRPIQVMNNIEVTFFNNGHLFGASMILVKISCHGEGVINLLFTGDYNKKNVFFDVDLLPSWIYQQPINIIQEATYGYMNSSEIDRCFIPNVVKKIEEGGTVVIPVFSLGRMQEILYLLKKLENQGVIPKEIPIYIDGKLGIRYTLMCKNGEFKIREDMQDFLPDNIAFVDKSTRPDVITDKRCKVIVTTSGMGSYGPAQSYIPAYITNANALIHFTGYVAEGTLGRQLKEAKKGESVTIRGVLYKKRADVEYTSEFSAHAKADEMISFLKKFKHLNLVLVNHGETSSKEIFARRIEKEVKPRNVGILGRQYFFRITPDGLSTSKTSKFL